MQSFSEDPHGDLHHASARRHRTNGDMALVRKSSDGSILRTMTRDRAVWERHSATAASTKPIA
ncbi:hypothetical protein FHX15_003541 [Rhizobium sp. BK650]|uniref:hypothetical protein n=1 Tax=Rhizobium sp. BK650 TaxID=2586990 RepID=UPI00160FDB76|nr:hypothetical protein [Rhizobium sp. BK650]MBB3658299.1 hypothetical protein [Rhizobium sp. BK650]